MKFHVRSPDSDGGAVREHRHHHRRRHRRYHVRPEALGLGKYDSEESQPADADEESMSWGSVGLIVLIIAVVLLGIDIVIRIMGHF